MVRLAHGLGEAEAHELAYQASMSAWGSGRSLTVLATAKARQVEEGIDG